jgi:hypothetical protein
MKIVFRLISIAAVTLLTFAVPTNAYSSDSIKETLERIDAEYSSLPMSIESAEKLFALDNELRNVVAEANKIYPRDKIDSLLYLKNEKLGLYLNRALLYSGKLMDEGDKLLPPYVPLAQRKNSTPLVRGEKFTALKDELERIYSEYSALAMKPDDADALYKLHMETTSAVEKIDKYYPYDLSQKFWDNKYVKIGLGIGHYSDQLEYSGKLILDLHKVNPNSRYREEALWKSLYGEYSSGNYENNTPKIELIYTYLKEFPNGVYASTAYNNLASFYLGFYRFMRYNKNDPRKKECYESYMSQRPIKEQIQQARDKGIEMYQKAISTSKNPSDNQRYEMRLAELRKGTYSEYDEWCYEMD